MITCIIARANAASDPGRISMTSSDLRSGLCISDIDGNDPSTTLLRGHKMPRCIGLAGEMGSPHDDRLGIRPHVLLGVDLERAGEANAEAARGLSRSSPLPNTGSRRGWRSGRASDCPCASFQFASRQLSWMRRSRISRFSSTSCKRARGLGVRLRRR